MNNLGYSNDTLLIGTSRIKGQGQTLIIGDDNNGLGYELPVEKGTEGQVLTMNADNTTSFQDASGGSMTRVGAGDNNTISIPGSTLGVPLVPSFQGVKIVDIKNIPPGSSYIIEAVSAVEFTYDGTSPTIQSYLGVNLNLALGGTSSNTIVVNNQSNPNVYPSPVVVGTSYRANWYYKAVITRNFNATAFFISTFSTMNRFGNQNYIVNMPTIPTSGIFFPIDGDQNDTTIDFDLTIDQALGAGTIVRYFAPSVNWYVSQLSEVNPPTLSTNDHTQLTNLNSGDAGHTQFPLLNGRSGGQILSGGLTPLHFLTLKAHNAGLNNIVIKDLNTTFEKNIDMDSNDINNANIISSSGVLNIKQNTPANDIKLSVDTEELVIKQNAFGGVKLIELDPLKQVQIGVDDGIGNDSNIRTLSTSTQFDKNIEMNANINDNSGGTNVIGNGVLFWGDVRSTKLTGDGIYEKSGGSQSLELNAVDTKSLKNIDMNNNDIVNCSDILGQGTNRINLNPPGQMEFISTIAAINGSSQVAIASNSAIVNRISGTDKLLMNAAGVQVLNGSLDMATNDITNANVIVRASNGNVIELDNDIAPPFITGALTINSGVGKQLRVASGEVLVLNSTNGTTYDTGSGSHLFRNTPDGTILTLGSEIGANKNLNMLLNSIDNANIVNVMSSNNITLPIVIGTPSGALQVQNGGAYIKQDLQVDGTIYCNNINGIRPSGGLYSESSGFNVAAATLTETNLLGQGGSAGTLAVPAGGFTQYDSYSFKASGVLSGGSNDTATLRLKSLVNGTTPVELGSIVITLTDNGLVDVAWKVEADFNVRTLGAAGVGVVVLSGNFAYTNNNDVVKTYLRTIVNNSVFDTTQSNELQFTYQNDATNPLTNIRIDQASFTKWY